MRSTHDNCKGVACNLHETYQALLPISTGGFDIVNDNARTHSHFSMELARRSRRSILSSETEADCQFHARFESLCEDFDQPLRRPRLHPNASFPPPKKPRRGRPPPETFAFDRWGASSDSDVSSAHDDDECTEPPRSLAMRNAPQLPSRQLSVDDDDLCALIADMQAS